LDCCLIITDSGVIAKETTIMEWQPIETAPKDGTWVELWRGKSHIGHWMPKVIGRWKADVNGGVFVWPCDPYDVWHNEEYANSMIDDLGDYYFDEESFTHWKPLDAPEAQ
jgi:hypothetical protein